MGHYRHNVANRFPVGGFQTYEPVVKKGLTLAVLGPRPASLLPRCLWDDCYAPAPRNLAGLEVGGVEAGIGSVADYTDDAVPTTGRRHDPASVRPLSKEYRLR
jgi:hypothetical protein